MSGRRSFLIGCGGLVAAPAVAAILPAWATDHSARPLPVDPLPPKVVAETAAPQNFVLRIAGWESSDDAEHAKDGEVWIRINSSWRTGWH